MFPRKAIATMSLSVWRVWAILLVGALALPGCGGSADKEPAADQGAEETNNGTGVKRVSAAKLPPLGNPLPPNLDQGRISNLAPPKGWQPLQRDNAFVARFAENRTNPNDLPRILITASDAEGFTDDVTADNVAEFAESLAAELDEKKLLETPKPLVIGDNAYARYVGKASKASRLVARQVLETVFDGRRYKITLETFDANLLKHRDLAYAIAAAVQFTRPGETPAATPEAPAEEAKSE
jgi:hypothetical protein